jgi:ribosome-associated heat shock protein Hsp15
LGGPSGKPNPDVGPKLRLDKWLWQARFFKTRDLAAQTVGQGHLRINGNRCSKAGHGIGIGDVLTFPQGNRVRVVRVLALGLRRGPAAEAQDLYFDLDPVSPTEAEGPPPTALE